MKMIDVMECVSLLKEFDNYLILSHRNPDGDTLGSAFALKRALDLLGKKSMVRCNDEMADKFSYLWQNLDNSEIKFDKIIAVDVADKKLLGEEFEAKYGDNVFLCIDHHMSNREYAENLLLEDRAAAAVVIYEVICELGVEITPEIANCVYTGLATDTGCFMFSNTTPTVHRIAAEVMEKGADYTLINRLMFETRTLSYIKLEQMAVASIESHFNGKCAIMIITQEMFKESGSDESECDGIASIPRKIEGVKVGVTIREQTNGKYKVSLRTVEPFDAAKICSHFGGGGHNRAAGCEFDCSLDKVKIQLLSKIADCFE
ncbi:MAG: bifunctional oligoribonuclease/PAP phosphatase NrnA [Clostridia bacterium]|nr:bifunctional oligoribonuclease/PAP phosphatase NrnA [Clostridia bacterium]